ncbi:MAG: UDP-2,3-diacylglucosamine diphosphatase LpxI [Verrucomicrobiota bacterium]|nr:UDP-2,3-diacylglucosamine diphosphatase LpxI [Verrucomicrobiota bacterium]
MNTRSEGLGIIAGSRMLPLLIAAEARKTGIHPLVAVAFEGETDPQIQSLTDEVTWLKVGQLSKMIEAFTRGGVNRCVMAGQIAPKNLFDLRPDFRAMTLLFRLKERNAHTIFGGIADELKKDGIELIEATPWLKPHMPGKKFELGPKLKHEQQEDLFFGYNLAKEISRLDIGQTVVVKNGTILAVEAFEGTDACLLRGGTLAGKEGGAIAVKVAKENHDLRFDIPCIGADTIRTCIQARVAVLGLEAERTILLERPEVEALLSEHRISLVTV